MTKYINLHKNYTFIRGDYQLKLPLNIEYIIPVNDSVRLLRKFIEEMDLTDLYSTYSRIRENQATPRQMLKIVHENKVKIKHIKKLRKKLYTLKQKENIEFVHGSGKRKNPIQRSIETLEEYLKKLKEYTKKSILVVNVTSIQKLTTQHL